MAGQQDRKLPWGSDGTGDIIEQGRGDAAPRWAERFRWRRPAAGRPPAGRVAAGLVVAALAVGALGGYLAGDAHGRSPAAASRPVAPRAPVTSAMGLAETGSQCAVPLGGSLQLGIEVVNGTGTGIRLGPVTARFPLGGVKLTAASWGPCGTMTFTRPQTGGVLAAGTSTWLTVTVSTRKRCLTGLPVEYVVSYSEQGQTFTLVFPGFADPGGIPPEGCSQSSGLS